MKKTAHGFPLVLDGQNAFEIKQIEAYDEISIQEIIFNHPTCLPISDIDESFNPIIPVCMEMNTPVGPLDIFMISPNGELIIIETKLWRNPEARRTVVAQILDYAKELSKWSYEDLQREVNRKLKRSGNTLYEISKKANENLTLDEKNFVDSVNRNLSRGKFLLLIVGDGIREGTHGLSEFLLTAGRLNFSFALVELAIYSNDRIQIIVPRTIAKTVEIQKINIELQEGLTITTDSNSGSESNTPISNSKEWENEKLFYQNFWEELIAEISFDDPGQPHPKPALGQNLYLYPSISRKAWISAYFMKSKKRVGVYFRCQNDIEGNKIYSLLSEDKETIKQELGDDVIWSWDEGDGVGVRLNCENIFEESNREYIKDFFKLWLNNFTNVFRPRMKEV